MITDHPIKEKNIKLVRKKQNNIEEEIKMNYDNHYDKKKNWSKNNKKSLIKK